MHKKAQGCARPLVRLLGEPWLWLLMGSLAALTAAQAGEAYSEEAVKAAFLYRFTGYVQWPPEALKTETFTIAVLGARATASELRQILPGQSVKGLPARVREIHSPREIDGAHVLYIGRSYTGDLRRLIHNVGSRPVLVVTDDNHGLDVGGAVNFLPAGRRVRFEISLPATDRAGLRISAELLAVAARVRGASRLDACPASTAIDRIEPGCTQWIARR